MALKLYYSPGSCSLSPHIALEESGLPYEAILAPTKTKQLPDGSDYRKVNPLGYVPFLTLPDGTGLREGAAIVQYVADQAPAKKLAPPNGTVARYQMQSWLNFIATELHKQFGPLFTPGMPDEIKQTVRDKITGRFSWVNGELADKPYLMGSDFTVADGYLFTVINWTKSVGIDISAFGNLRAYHDRIAARPAVKAVLKAEGLA